MGKPWVNNGKIMFKMDALMNFLRSRQFTEYERPKVQHELRRLNGGKECTSPVSYRRADGKRSSVRVWWVPEYEDESVDLAIHDISDDVPF